MGYEGTGSSLGFQVMNSPLDDTTYRKVFVGGMAWETNNETMLRYFQQFGHILEAVVITDKNTALSKGYGFVTFRDPEADQRACADPVPIIHDGRRTNCNLASLGRPRPLLPYGRIRPASPYVGSLQPARGANVGGYGYQQHVSYNYQQGLVYPPYGYTMAYEPEYIYPQVICSDAHKVVSESVQMAKETGMCTQELIDVVFVHTSCHMFTTRLSLKRLLPKKYWFYYSLSDLNFEL